MTVVVVDASVAVAWYVEEAGSAVARRLALSDRSLIAPGLLLLEIANALARMTATGAARNGFAGDVIRSLRQRRAVVLHDTEPLIIHAAALAEALQHPIYDCIYLALSQREGAALATFDRRLARHARDLSISLWSGEDAP
ncbi:type II toxin-antitoxin system VapC family toxin [Leptolyngbya sp. 15MV]|nr:type II toxin-antitoxin system VapC family toxin [Leptolyngbya sp. 15MV]